MEKKIHIEVIECDCVPWQLDDDSSPEEIALAEEWWKEIGQHSSRFKASLADTRFEGQTFISRVESPLFMRDDEKGRQRAKEDLDEWIVESIRLRTEAHPDPA